MANARGRPAKRKLRRSKRQSTPRFKAGNQRAKRDANLIAFTVDRESAQVVRLERLDSTGARREFSRAERTDLVRKASGHNKVREALEQAFEAGLACALGGKVEPDKAEESDQDAELRHLLLAPLMQHSAVKHLMQPDVLNRAILETLIEQSASRRAALQAGH